MSDPRVHLRALGAALAELEGDLDVVQEWGARIGRRLCDGGRLLVAGNGGSAAHAQHLTGELVGRFRAERRPLSAIALNADSSSLTAIVNDYGADEAFARQVRAHGRPGDILLAISTSGGSPNVVEAVGAARETGMVALALTGPGPSAVAARCDEALAVAGATTATVQEVHQVVIHLICAAVDDEVPSHPHPTEASWAR